MASRSAQTKSELFLIYIIVVRLGSFLIVIPAKPIHFSETKVILKDVPNGTIILRKPVPGAYAGMRVKSSSSTTATTKDSIK